MRRIIQFVGLIIVTSVFLIACTPVYEKTYRYEPPQATRGQTCVAQCQRAKSMCENFQQKQYQNCVATNDPQQCEQTSNLRCEADHRECYQLCGGKIVEEKVCVNNCDDAAV